MKLPYSKYSGAGNTFFFVDNRKQIVFSPSWITSLFKEGEKTDGLISIEPSLNADFRMRIFNPDGSEAEMCGNGLRACAKFLKEIGISQQTLWIESGAHEKHHVTCEEEKVFVSMGAPHSIQWNLPLEIGGDLYSVQFMNTGVPHTVLILSSLEKLASFPVETLGRTIRRHPLFAPAGTNVNFAVVIADQIILRTYERGVERETQACGTGATATALAASFLYGLPSPLKVRVQSQDFLTIHFKENFSEVTLEGPAVKIGEGFFEHC